MSRKWETIDCVVPFARNHGGWVRCEDDQGEMHKFNLIFFSLSLTPSFEPSRYLQWRKTSVGTVEIRRWNPKTGQSDRQITSALNPAQMEFLIGQNAPILTRDMLRSARAKVSEQLAAMGYRVTPEAKLAGSAPA